MKTNTITAILGLAFTVTPVFAQASAPAVAEPAETTTMTVEAQLPELVQDPLLVQGKLENGFSYIIRPTKEPAGRACLRLIVTTGSLDEQEETSGISHFIEHMVFNGSRSFERGELIPAMQRLGLGFGGDANAYTSLDKTVYMLDLPNLNEETVNFAFTIMRDFADGAKLEDDALDHERGIIVSELKSRDSQNYRAMLATIDQLAEGTRLAHYMPIGREEVIRNAPYELFRKYYSEHYVAERMTLIVTGDVDPAVAETWVRQYFGSMEAKPSPARQDNGSLTNAGPSTRIIPNTEQATTSIMANVSNPWKHEPDTFMQRVKDFPLQLACLMLNNRLSRIAQQPNAPIMAAEVSESSLFHLVDSFGFSAKAQPDRWQDALNCTEQELRRAIQYGFEPHEFQEALSAVGARLHHMAQSWETISASNMADFLIDAQDGPQVPTSAEEDMRVFSAAVAYISQDPDSCRRALQEAFDYARVKLTMTGTIPAGVTEESLRGAFDQSTATAVEKPDLRPTRPFAYDEIGTPGTIVRKDYIEDLDVTTITLSNGVRVNLKPVDFRKGGLTVSAAVDGGSLRLPNRPGLAMVANNLLSIGALEEHDLDELKRIMMGHNVDLNAGMTDTRIVFSGGTTQEDLELQCKLIVANILHPGYKQDALTLMHSKLPAFYRRLTTTPNGAFTMQSGRALYGEDPRFNVPTMEEVMAITVDDVKAVLQPWLQNGAIEVTLVGDFDLEATLPILERTFGAMPARNPEFTELTPEQRSVNMQPWGQRRFFTYPTELDKTLVVHVRDAGDGRDHRRNRRLQVLCEIADAMLFDGIRAEMGETYSPSVRLTLNSEINGAAQIVATSAGVVRNRELVSSAIDSLLTSLGTGDITQESFDCAIRPIISAAEKSLRQNAYWCSSLADIQSNPEQLALVRDRLEDLRSIKLEEIQQLAREVFGHNRVNFYFTMPEGTVPADAESPATPEATPAPEEPAAAEESAKQAPKRGSELNYVVVTTQATYDTPEWRPVLTALSDKYPGAQLVVVESISEESFTEALRGANARHAAIVLRPEEVNRVTVNHLHRASRSVDDDLWGDCLWGIITGYSAEDALRIAKDDTPLVIKRLLGTTNVGWHPFEYSYCITDWTNSPVLEQTGYTEPTTTTYDNSTPEGRHIMADGMQSLFGERLANAKAQMVVTSSHATQFNLEMPFSRGLIFPANNRFYMLSSPDMRDFYTPLSQALRGRTEGLAALAEKNGCPAIEPDGTTRVWIAAGNCLFGDAHSSNQSMAITALSAYTCNQVVGYTVPSWYGAGGWGTLGTFVGVEENTTLAQAWYLNNQFILHNTTKIDPVLLNVRFDGESLDYRFQVAVMRSGVRFTDRDTAHNALGLVHDRDVVAFYGDPAWSATIDSSHAKRPLTVTWQGDKTFTITANHDYKGQLGVWFPTAATGQNATGCDAEGAIFTDDFILFPELELKQGESRTINIR